MTTTAQNIKISPNFPARKSPGTLENRANFPILRNEQIQNVYKKSKFYSSDILQKADVNQMKPT